MNISWKINEWDFPPGAWDTRIGYAIVPSNSFDCPFNRLSSIYMFQDTYGLGLY